MPPAPRVRLSNVIVREGRDMDDLRITSPANADLERNPCRRPSRIRTASSSRRKWPLRRSVPDARALWDGAQTLRYPIDADRDVNGVGLVYFIYVAIMDWAERALVARGYAPSALDGRRTRRRRIGFYGRCATTHSTSRSRRCCWRPLSRLCCCTAASAARGTAA